MTSLGSLLLIVLLFVVSGAEGSSASSSPARCVVFDGHPNECESFFKDSKAGYFYYLPSGNTTSELDVRTPLNDSCRDIRLSFNR